MLAYDGDVIFSGGQNNGALPHVLPPGNLHEGINVRCRSGGLEPRAGYSPVVLNLNGLKDDDTVASFLRGKFQGAIKYGHEQSLVVCIAGRLYYIAVSGEVTEIDGVDFDPTAREIYMVVAHDILIASDGASPLAVIDRSHNALLLDPDVKTNMLPGRWMAYGQGRIYQVNPDRTIIYASDAYTPLLADKSRLYSITEDPVGIAPYGIGKITGLHFLPILDSGTGVGQLLAFGVEGVYAFDVLTPREQWSELPIGRKIAGNFHTNSHRSLTSVNGDVYFRRDEGVGSLVSARTDWQTPTHRSISYEVNGWLCHDLDHGLDLVSGSYFDNTFRMTFDPRVADNGEMLFGGLIALDLESSSGLSQGRPIYNGVEFGILPLQVVDDTLIGRGEDGGNLRVYNFDPLASDPGRIEYRVNTRGFQFSAPAQSKHLYGVATIDVANIQDKEIDLLIEYRPDNVPRWYKWTTRKIIVAGDCATPYNGAAYCRLQLGVPDEEWVDDKLTQRLSTSFGSIQVRVTVKGHCRIDKILLSATVGESPDDSMHDSDVIEVVEVAVSCQDNTFDYILPETPFILDQPDQGLPEIPVEPPPVEPPVDPPVEPPIDPPIDPPDGGLTDPGGVPITDPGGTPITDPQ